MDWLELSIDAAREAVDWVGMILAANGYSGDVSVVERAEPPVDVAREQENPSWTFTIRLYLPQDGDAGPMVAKLTDGLAALRRTELIGELRARSVEDKRAPRSRSGPRRVGQRFVIAAPGEEVEPRPDDLVVRLAPGLTFGTGLHPTTRLSLELLERHVVPGMDVLDLGCGSGILSVALAKLGAHVVALDNDPIAVRATRENVRDNGVQHGVVIAEGSLGTGANLGHWMGWNMAVSSEAADAPEPFDLIVANILARVHIALAHDYRQALRRSGNHPGLLITAGFTAEREDEVALALEKAGFEPIDRQQADEWVALTHRALPL